MCLCKNWLSLTLNEELEEDKVEDVSVPAETFRLLCSFICRFSTRAGKETAETRNKALALLLNNESDMQLVTLAYCVFLSGPPLWMTQALQMDDRKGRMDEQYCPVEENKSLPFLLINPKIFKTVYTEVWGDLDSKSY